jgi:hypothetical protein
VFCRIDVSLAHMDLVTNENLLHDVIQSVHRHCSPDILRLLPETSCSSSVCIAVKAMHEEVLVLSEDI